MRKCQDSITVETSFVPEEGAKACGCDDASHCRKCIPASLHGASISREDTHGSQARCGSRTNAASRSVAADPRSATGDCADCTVRDGQPRAGHLVSYRTTHRSPKPTESSPPGSPSDGPAPEVDCPTPVEIDYDDYDKETGELVGAGIQRIPCGRKRCPVCGPRLKSRYIAHHAQNFGAYAEKMPVFFATLTLDPKIGDLSLDESRRYLLHCWDKWMKRLRRRADGGLHYVASIEQHKDGRYHMHAILAATFSDMETARMMREQWFESGGGALSEAKRITVGSEDLGADDKPTGVAGAVGYVMKYAFKDANTMPGRRSVVCSQGDGYHSAEAKAEREAFYKSTKKGQWQERQKKKRERDWHPPTNDRPPQPMRDTITPEDRARFERLDMRMKTRTYKDKQPDGTWKVYTYRKEKDEDGKVEERLTWVQYSTYPDRAHARVVDTSGIGNE